MNSLERRVIEITYQKKLTHLSSCLTCVNAIDAIYTSKNPQEPFILSNGHAFLAQAVVMEKHEGKDAEVLVEKNGTHPNRCPEDGIFCSTGSLGQGLTVAVGMALADRSRNVYAMISDGECAEGSVWEALKIAAEQRLENLRVVVVANGYSALDKVDVEYLKKRIESFYPCVFLEPNVFKFPEEIQGINGHYVVVDETLYKKLLEC